MEDSHMLNRALIAAVGFFAIAGLLFAAAFTASTLPSNSVTQAEASTQAQIAREVAAMRLARTAKPSSPMFTATSKGSAS
jgi:hypothetical protein